MADAEARRPNSFLVFLGTVAAITVVLIIVGGLVAEKPKVESVEAKRAQQRIEAREKLDKAAHEQLMTADWVDKAKGVVRVPVDDAMKLVAVDLAAKKPAPSQVKVDPPLPMPPPYDPNSKEPPISALPSAPQGADTIRFDLPAAPPATAPPAAVPAVPTPPGAVPAAPAPPAAVPAAPVPPAPAPPAAPPPPAAAIAPVSERATATAAPNRPPLIHFTEKSEPEK